MKVLSKTCCVTGHRYKGFPWDYNTDKARTKAYLKRMYDIIENVITKGGFTHFISGGALGVDMDFAEAVLYFRDKKHYAISLEIAIPCPNQDLKWSKQDKERYKTILDSADIKTLISEQYTSFCMHKRNEYMVDNSDLVLAFWNGKEFGGTYYTLTYAKKKNKQVFCCMLNDFSSN